MNAREAEAAAARRATRWIFLVAGISLAAWAPMVPFVKERLALDEAELGLVLLALGLGAMLTMPITGVLIHRHGSRRLVFFTGLALAAALPCLPLMNSPLLLAAALFVFGAALGGLDVSMNAQAVAIEKQTPWPIMSGFHGLFSVGGLIGAAGVSLLLEMNVPVAQCALGIAAVAAVLVLTQTRGMLARDFGEEAQPMLALPHGAVAGLGVLAFICFLAEGVVLDWSAVFLRFSRGYDLAAAGLGFAAFSVAMALGRLTGDWVTQRLGPVRILRYGGLLAAAGFLLAVAWPHGTAAIAGFVLVGLGAANVVPVLFSAAGKSGGAAAGMALAAVTTMGYAGMLAGPAAVGFIARYTSLSAAFLFVALLLLYVALRAGSARPAPME